MTLRSQLVLILIVVVVCVAVEVGRGIYFELRADELAPIAQKYRSICGGVKATLFVDRRMLHTNDHERDVLLGRLGGDCGDDSAVMLERCLPEPFPMEKWRRCVETHDVTCLDAMLAAAEASIP